MSLNDIDVAVLAGQAVGLLDDDVLTEIEPLDPLDPYVRRTVAWRVWPRLDPSHRTLSVRVTARMTAPEALAHIIRALSEHVAISTTFWAHTFPVCPGHEHASDVGVDGADVILTCPVDAREVERIEPALE